MSYNPYKKYCDLWWKYWLNLPGDIIRFLKRLRDYAPIIWEDQDWDFDFILTLIRFKLERMYPVIKRGLAAHREQRALEIQQAIVLLENIKDDPDDEWTLHYDQWRSQSKGFNDCHNQDEHMKALELSRKRQEENWHKLWEHFDKCMQGWWD